MGVFYKMSREKSSSLSKSNGHDRTRLWAAVVYPDSAPSDWREILNEGRFEWAESPLHDKDFNANGEVKKAHWHIVMSFDGVKSFEQVCEILAPINCPIPQKCHSAKGAVRYFVHMDNPEKHSYSVSDIVSHNGFDVAAALQPSSSQRYDLIAEMLSFIRENNFSEFQDFADYAMVCRRSDWFPLLCDSCAVIVQQYLKSVRHRAGTAAADVRVDLSTGEIVR